MISVYFCTYAAVSTVPLSEPTAAPLEDSPRSVRSLLVRYTQHQPRFSPLYFRLWRRFDLQLVVIIHYFTTDSDGIMDKVFEHEDLDRNHKDMATGDRQIEYS